MPNYRIKLRRSVLDRVLGGVCGGCGDCLGISGWWIRLGFGALALASLGYALLLYVLLWVSLPQQRFGDLPPLVHPGEPEPQRFSRPEGLLTLGVVAIFAGVCILGNQAGIFRLSSGADLLLPAMLLLIGLIVLLKHLRGVA